MKHIYVVIDTESRDDRVNGIMGVWTSKKAASDQARFLRTYRMSDCIKLIDYGCCNIENGYWLQSIFTEPSPF